MEITEIEEKLKGKYNKETRYYIAKYIKLNEDLYGKILSVDEKFIDRLTTNLPNNIKSSWKMVYPHKISGMYDRKEKTIFVNPEKKIKSKLSEKHKSRMLTMMMHELDHAATATTHTENGKTWPALGIANQPGTDLDLSLLNEGITAYKEEEYAKKLGSEYNSSYKDEKKVAEFLVSIIGKENLIKHHYNNDYSAIKKEFYENTGADLDAIVEVLNKESPTGKLKGQEHNGPRKLDEMLNDIKMKFEERKQNKNNKDILTEEENKDIPLKDIQTREENKDIPLKDIQTGEQDTISTQDIGKRTIGANTTDKSVITRIFEKAKDFVKGMFR